MWFKDSLLLIRRCMTLSSIVQGIMVDQAALEKLLLNEAKLYLPNARLSRPIRDADDSFALASFPLRLIPGIIDLKADPGDSVDLSTSQPERVGQLGKKIDFFLKSTRARSFSQNPNFKGDFEKW